MDSSTSAASPGVCLASDGCSRVPRSLSTHIQRFFPFFSSPSQSCSLFSSLFFPSLVVLFKGDELDANGSSILPSFIFFYRFNFFLFFSSLSLSFSLLFGASLQMEKKSVQLWMARRHSTQKQKKEMRSLLNSAYRKQKAWR